MWNTRIEAKSIVPIIVGVFCLAIVVVVARPRINQAPTDRIAAEEALSILTKNQPDSPLTITSVIVDDSPDGLMPTVHFNVINNSGKHVMVYAIKHEAALKSRGMVSGSILVNSPDRDHALRPGKAPQVEISGIRYPERPDSLTLSVDFVEFADGTRWGEDTFKNGDRIDGVRAGANAERDALMKVLRSDGPEELIRALDSITPESTQASPRSTEWLDGFRHGVGWIRERARSKGQSLTEIERELRPPVDSTNDNR